MQELIRKRFQPLLLTLFVIIFDQLSKFLVMHFINPWTVGCSLFNDFFRIIHVYNPGIAFSIGGSLSDSLRSLLFGLLPLIVIIIVLVVYFRSDEFTIFQRWCISGIIGGGIGNLLDRFFRSDGVLDFIDIKFYGFLGLQRWPTFNIADSSVVICGLLLLFSLFFQIRNSKDNNDE